MARVIKGKSANAVAALRMELEKKDLSPEERRGELRAKLAAGYSPQEVSQACGVPLDEVYAVGADPESAEAIALAATGMVMAGLPASVQTLINLLGDESPWVRAQAAQALIGIAQRREQAGESAPQVEWAAMPKPPLPGVEE